MMAPRALWKGTLRVAELGCHVALHAAASTSDRIAFHILDRRTGNRVRRDYIDSETGHSVGREDQVKGYRTQEGDWVILDPEEIAAAVPESDKILDVENFITCREVDDVYFDRPYYLTAADRGAEETYHLLREGMIRRKVAALARAVLFRRVRTVLIRPHAEGLIASTLNFDHEVRPAREAFRDIPDLEIRGEMLDLARHIIDTKLGRFDISRFEDRYEAALADLVRAKIEGRPIPARREPEGEKVVDLMSALRASAEAGRRRKSPAKANRMRGTG